MNDDSDKYKQGNGQDLPGIHFLDDTETCEIVALDENSDFQSFLQTGLSGLKFVPTKYRSYEGKLLSPDAGDFSKWLKCNHSEVNLAIDRGDGTLVLRSSDFWMPLVFLASDIALPIYLNLVSNYIYDRMKGALRNEKARVHLEAVFHDDKEGVSKKFRYEGDVESLQKIIKKFDLNCFLDK
jgi:hypothetical protein